MGGKMMLNKFVSQLEIINIFSYKMHDFSRKSKNWNSSKKQHSIDPPAFNLMTFWPLQLSSLMIQSRDTLNPAKTSKQAPRESRNYETKIKILYRGKFSRYASDKFPSIMEFIFVMNLINSASHYLKA